MRLLFIFFLALTNVVGFSQTDSLKTDLLKHEIRDERQNELKSFKSELRDDVQAKLQHFSKVENQIHHTIHLYAIIGGVLLSLITFIGYQALKKMVQSGLNKEINKAFYKINPINTPIKLPRSKMDKQANLLKQLEFTNITYYSELGNDCTQDVVVYMATSDDEAKELEDFLTEWNLRDRYDVAYVVFTKGEHLNTALRTYDNVTFANNHLSLVQAIFVASRGVIPY